MSLSVLFVGMCMNAYVCTLPAKSLLLYEVHINLPHALFFFLTIFIIETFKHMQIIK